MANIITMSLTLMGVAHLESRANGGLRLVIMMMIFFLTVILVSDRCSDVRPMICRLVALCGCGFLSLLPLPPHRPGMLLLINIDCFTDPRAHCTSQSKSDGNLLANAKSKHRRTVAGSCRSCERWRIYRACIGSSSVQGVVGADEPCFMFSMFSLFHAPFIVFDDEKHSFMMNGNFVPL